MWIRSSRLHTGTIVFIVALHTAVGGRDPILLAELYILRALCLCYERG